MNGDQHRMTGGEVLYVCFSLKSSHSYVVGVNYKLLCVYHPTVVVVAQQKFEFRTPLNGDLIKRDKFSSR